MSLLITKEVSGLLYDIILKDGMMKRATEDDSPSYCLGLTGSYDSVEPLLELYDRETPTLVPDSHRLAFKECGYTGFVPWSRVLPAALYKSSFRNFVDSVNDSLELFSELPYPAFFRNTNKLFSMLSPAFLDKSACSRFLEEGDNHVLSSMLKLSDATGKIPVPVYNRVSTKTGRLVVKAGPQILTMKKEHRDVFRPSSPTSSLYEVDFTSLEPRVALNVAGRDCSSDVYTSFASESGLDVSRDVAKLAVLCALYGAGKYRLESVLRKDNSPVKAHTLLKAVKSYFCIATLSRALVKEAESGMISNCFGRPIEVDDSRNTVLINNFLQSSAADIALAGFLDFCETFSESIRPLFIIHDALVFEAAPENLAPITEYVNKGFNIKSMGNFPLKITEFGSHE